MPDRNDLERLRQSIDRHPRRWREALNQPHLKRVFFPSVKPGADAEKAVAAFLDRNKSNALKKRPMVRHQMLNMPLDTLSQDEY